MRELRNGDLAITIIEDFEPSWLDTKGLRGIGMSGNQAFAHTSLLSIDAHLS